MIMKIYLKKIILLYQIALFLKNLPSGTFLMGGTTIHNDAPIVSVTLSAFQISKKEITNNEYINFLNSAYSK